MILGEYVVQQISQDEVVASLHREGEGIVDEVPQLAGAKHVGHGRIL